MPTLLKRIGESAAHFQSLFVAKRTFHGDLGISFNFKSERLDTSKIAGVLIHQLCRW